MPTSADRQAAWQPVPKGQARENIPRVLVKVLVETNGCASRAEIRQSSGYPSLDNYAVRRLLATRFLPGTRNGTPDAMWVTVPFLFAPSGMHGRAHVRRARRAAQVIAHGAQRAAIRCDTLFHAAPSRCLR